MTGGAWTSYNYFIAFVFAIKILFIILAIIHYYLVRKGKENTEFAENIVYWKERCHFIFIASMSILTIMIFRPFNVKPILLDKESRFLFLVFGIITLIDANWSIFFQQAKWFSLLQSILGNANGGTNATTNSSSNAVDM